MKNFSNRLCALAITSLLLSATAIAQSIPSFAPPVTFPAPGTSAIALGDMNGDGKLDAVTANGATSGSHGVSVLLSNGDGSFQPAVNFVTNTDPTRIVIGDFNNDGKLDVAAANKTANTLSILLGNGDGTLQQATTVILPSSPILMYASDLNGDGNKDLVVTLQSIAPLTGAGSYLTGILMSNGDGTFAQSSFPAVSTNVLVADFNGDGKPDLFLYQNLAGLSVDLIKFGNGDGTFTDAPLPFAPLPARFSATELVAGDFNGDGRIDIYGEYVVASSTRSPAGFSATMALGKGDGTFNIINYPSNRGIDGQNLIVGDFNRDGNLDVAGIFPGPLHFSSLIPPYSLRILYGAGDGTLSLPVSFPAGSSSSVFTGQPLVSADFDGNGAPDFAVATSAGLTVVRNANGTPPLLSSLSVNARWVVGGNTTVLGTVTIGDPAPAGGAVIALSSSDPIGASFPGGAVTIAAGATSATFTIATGVVPAAEFVTITASWNGVNQTAGFNVVPAYTLSSIVLASSSNFGWFGGGSGTVGTVTLSSPAIENVVVSVNTSNAALVSVFTAMPLLIPIPAGQTTGSFSVSILNKVAVDTPVAITASLDGISRSATLTVRTASDTVRITKAEYSVKTASWKIEATSSNPLAVIRVLTTAGTGTDPFGGVALLQSSGNGIYKGSGVAPPPFTSVFLQSTLGGFAIGPVAQK